MPAIFISYRRSETSGFSGRIYDRLRAILGNANVFMDVESIEPGEDWRARLRERIARADIVLVLIGAEWLTLTDEHGRRRIDDPDDVTHWEIAGAAAQGKRIIPILLQGAPLPRRTDLPALLAPLADRQYVEIRHESFDAGSCGARITQVHVAQAFQSLQHIDSDVGNFCPVQIQLFELQQIFQML